MKDFAGNDLEPGDDVVYAGETRLKKGSVVQLSYTDGKGSLLIRSQDDVEFWEDPDLVIKVPKEFAPNIYS